MILIKKMKESKSPETGIELNLDITLLKRDNFSSVY